MKQWIIRKIIGLMGRVYVFLDKFLTHDTREVLGVPIDEDFQKMSRKQLCRYIEVKLGWEDNDFWNLESTQKIRLCCQVARLNKFSLGEEE
ncbi:MAG: hypothetical protein GOVbin4206_12 [Prokaryotic dsDNA virus sp.]|nr:MAG: hypothetical protein GOVbin4206_12 [Prokaryotic dsDNA virus sp.]|tara:strand:- start:3764 stop:4036 length:273 start_codon:yes stop_codon:yes gene_type:complete